MSVPVSSRPRPGLLVLVLLLVGGRLDGIARVAFPAVFLVVLLGTALI